MTWALLLPCALLCSLGYRVRGGWLAPWHVPGQVSRLAFCAAGALTALAAGAVWWHALTLIPAFFVGCVIPLFGAIDLGRNEGSFTGDFALLMARGTLGVMFAAAALLVFGHGLAVSWTTIHQPALKLMLSVPSGLSTTGTADYPAWWMLLASGPLMGPAYWLARQGRVNAPALGCTPSDWPPTGELLTGAAFGVGTFLAVAL